MENEEKVALAYDIKETEHLFHRYCNRQMHHEMGADCSCSFTPPQIHMVMTIHDRGSMTIKQLTQALCVKAPAVSAMVDRLVEMGVLTRTENPLDRREVLVQVSPDEDAHIERIERAYVQMIIELCDKIGDDLARMWGVLNTRLREVLEKEMVSH